MFQESIENKNRVSGFLKKLKSYYILTQSGIAELAPDNWDPSK